MRSGDLSLDPGRRIAYRGGRRLDLSAKELAVLELLLAARGSRRLVRGAAGQGVGRGRRPVLGNVVKVTISRLRRKLGDPPIIETVPGAGYRI